MKKIFFLTALLGSYVLIQAQTKAPSVIKESFAKQFPGAVNIKWGKENAKEYEAEFILKGVRMSANYDLQGNWKETETEIQIKDLPEAVIKSIKTKYPGTTISGASRTENPGGKIIYEANIKVNGKKKGLELFGDGKFVK